MSAISLGRPSSKLRTDRQQYRLLFAVTYPIFLATVLAVRVGRRAGFVGQPPRTPKSLFVEARALSSGALQFAFMG